MSRFVVRSRAIKAMATSVVIVGGAVYAHGSVTQAARESQIVESAECRRPPHEGHDGHAAWYSGQVPTDVRPGSSGGLQQTASVGVPASVFLRVDKRGRVTAAATNTGCVPRRGDDVYLFQPSGSIKAAGFDLNSCHWTGDFTIAGRFQPQSCGADDIGQGTEDGHHRSNDGDGNTRQRRPVLGAPSLVAEVMMNDNG